MLRVKRSQTFGHSCTQRGCIRCRYTIFQSAVPAGLSKIERKTDGSLLSYVYRQLWRNTMNNMHNDVTVAPSNSLQLALTLWASGPHRKQWYIISTKVGPHSLKFVNKIWLLCSNQCTHTPARAYFIHFLCWYFFSFTASAIKHSNRGREPTWCFLSSCQRQEGAPSRRGPHVIV